MVPSSPRLTNGEYGGALPGSGEGRNTAASPSMSRFAARVSRSSGSASSRRVPTMAASIRADAATRPIRAWIWLPALAARAAAS